MPEMFVTQTYVLQCVTLIAPFTKQADTHLSGFALLITV